MSAEEPAECEARVERERAIDQRRHRAEVLAEIGQYHGGDGEDARIVARLLQCPVGVIDAFQSVRIAVVAPPVTMQLERAQRGPGQREPVVRVAGDRPLRKTQRLRDFPSRRPVHRMGTQIEIIGREFGSLTAR